MKCAQLTRRRVLQAHLLQSCIGASTGFLCCQLRKSGSRPTFSPSRKQQTVQMGAVRPLTLVLLGDVMLGRLVDDSFTCDALRKTAAFGNVLPFLQGMDPATTIIAGNLECAITSHSQPTPKAFNFKLSPANADVLQQLRLGFVATANNHVLDYGQPGLKETNEVLDRLGVSHAGSGLQPAASQPAAVTTPSGHRVAFLSYSDHYEDWAATTDTPGINFIDPASFDQALLQQQVAAARAVGPDLVVVMIHWGPNWRWQPSKQLRQLGKAFLDAGADLVFGTSPHHIQGVELVGHKAIVYSGGSFVDDYAGDDYYRNDLSAVMVAKLAPAVAAAAAAATGKAAAVQHAAPAGAFEDIQQHDDQGLTGLGSQLGADAEGGTSAASMGTASSRSSVVTATMATTTPAVAAPAAVGGRGAAAAAEWHLQRGDAPAAAAAADAGCCGEVAASGLVLQELHALPIAITHHWRDLTGDAARTGPGNPPYFSQVDFAEGDDWEWVADKLQQLSTALGNTRVTAVPEQHLIRIM